MRKLIVICATALMMVGCQSRKQDIYVLYDNDVHCAINGYEQMAAMRDSLLTQSEYVSCVSCGDFVQGSAVGDAYSAAFCFSSFFFSLTEFLGFLFFLAFDDNNQLAFKTFLTVTRRGIVKSCSDNLLVNLCKLTDNGNTADYHRITDSHTETVEEA